LGCRIRRGLATSVGGLTGIYWPRIEGSGEKMDKIYPEAHI